MKSEVSNIKFKNVTPKILKVGNKLKKGMISSTDNFIYQDCNSNIAQQGSSPFHSRDLMSFYLIL
jgi:hypothetical protein